MRVPVENSRCEQKLWAKPSTHETGPIRATGGGARTTRAWDGHTKRARLRALARRSCGGCLGKLGSRLIERLEDAARPVEDARRRDALRVVGDEAGGSVGSRVVRPVDAERPRNSTEAAEAASGIGGEVGLYQLFL